MSSDPPTEIWLHHALIDQEVKSCCGWFGGQLRYLGGKPVDNASGAYVGQSAGYAEAGVVDTVGITTVAG
jgi:hypothetical protein